ncbi:MAG: HAMP domain-containing histidine kinase [Spirochaetaceae bacterium]|nr:HAMP domain-containing histidine kinase [Spirochaetaceae bacterium]
MLLKQLKKTKKHRINKFISNLPITFQVTIWYMSFQFIIFSVLLIMAFFITDSFAYDVSKQELTNTIKKIASGEGVFKTYDESVYILRYSSKGELLEGQLPTLFTVDSIFNGGQVENFINDTADFLYFDARISNSANNEWIRGVYSISGLKNKLSLLLVALLIICPMFLIIIAFGGYSLIKKAFKPVSQISKTAYEIGKTNDLTRRIILKDGEDEIHQMTNAFNSMLDSLYDSSKREQQFTSDVSHELRTPISVILAESQYSELHIESLDEAKKSFEVITRQARRTTKLINQLLEISRMDQTIELDKENFDLSSILLSILQDYQTLAETSSIKLVYNIEDNVSIVGNKMMIQRVFDNLFSNALKFTDSYITIQLKAEADYCYLSIQDDGVGISEINQPKIWTRFYQEETSRSKDSNNGFGLGLSMVKKIIELHGGSITLKSAPGKGSTFNIKLKKF